MSEYVSVDGLSEKILRRDFDLLEDTSKTIFNAKRVEKYAGFQKRVLLRKEALQHGIDVKLFPSVFQRAVNNTSHVRRVKDAQGNSSVIIWWKVEWRFSLAMEDPVLFTDVCVSEFRILSDLISRFLLNTWKGGETKDILSDFLVGFDANSSISDFLTVSLASEPSISIDLSQNLKSILVGKQVIEFPVFLIKRRL